ncbi:MAG: zinc-ribbon domain-containing protein [Hyphomicrobiaceae bacterium]
MIIRCPNCGSTYDISKQPQAAGRKVKCMRCSHVWKAEAIDPAAAAPPAPAKSPEPVSAPPAPVAASEISVPRPVAPTLRVPAPPVPEPRVAQSSLFGPEPTAHAANGFNGTAETETNGYHAESFAAPQPAPLQPPPMPRRNDFEADEAPPPRRPAPPKGPDAGYFDDEPVAAAPRAPRQPPRQQYREPPQETYRDDAYGDYDRDQFGQDDFSPRRDARLDREPRGSSRGRRAATIVGWVAYLAAMGAIAAYAYAGRDQVVAWLPGAAPYYASFGMPVNRYGLEFRDVTAAWSTTPSGRRALAISVGVENVTKDAVKVPSVVIAFKDANGDELFYHAEADALPKTLQAGKTAKFAATVPVPADATRAVQVRFATGL